MSQARVKSTVIGEKLLANVAAKERSGFVRRREGLRQVTHRSAKDRRVSDRAVSENVLRGVQSGASGEKGEVVENNADLHDGACLRQAQLCGDNHVEVFLDGGRQERSAE